MKETTRARQENKTKLAKRKGHSAKLKNQGEKLQEKINKLPPLSQDHKPR